MTVPSGIAVWGLGNHAIKRIIPALHSMEELNLIGVCSRNQKSVTECAFEWDCIGWTNPTEMLENAKVHAIYISSPIGLHANFVNKALKAGKHVWCEKPLTCDYENTKNLIELANLGNQMLAECFMYLHHPQFNKVVKFAKGDQAGPVHFVSCRFGIPFLDEPGFRNDPDLCGGAFWDVACYTISAVLELFPNQEVKVVYSEICKKEDSPVDLEGCALLSFSKGLKAYLDWGIGLGYRNEIDLWAEQGSFYTDKIFSKTENYQPVFRLRDRNGNEQIEYGEPANQFVEMFRNFIDISADKKKISDESARILQQAKVMNDIFRFNIKKKQ